MWSNISIKERVGLYEGQNAEKYGMFLHRTIMVTHVYAFCTKCGIPLTFLSR